MKPIYFKWLAEGKSSGISMQHIFVALLFEALFFLGK